MAVTAIPLANIPESSITSPVNQLSPTLPKSSIATSMLSGSITIGLHIVNPVRLAAHIAMIHSNLISTLPILALLRFRRRRRWKVIVISRPHNITYILMPSIEAMPLACSNCC